MQLQLPSPQLQLDAPALQLQLPSPQLQFVPSEQFMPEPQLIPSKQGQLQFVAPSELQLQLQLQFPLQLQLLNENLDTSFSDTSLKLIFITVFFMPYTSSFINLRILGFASSHVTIIKIYIING